MTRRQALDGFQLRLQREAKRFELKPLLDLLRHKNYHRDQILFRSSSNGTSSALVEDVTFEPGTPTIVHVTLNVGLLSDNSLLPSYFFDVARQTYDPERFHDFLRFFDHSLLRAFVDGLFPEDGDRVFDDWGDAKNSFLRMLGLGSPSTMQWLMQLYFPEFKIHISRQSFFVESTAYAFRPGDSPLDGSGVLGSVYRTEASGLVVDLIIDEEKDSRNRGWAGIVRARLRRPVLPILAPFRLRMAIRLVVLQHASWALLEGKKPEAPPAPRPAAQKPGAPQGQDPQGYLGYDRLFVEEDSGHTMVLFRGITGETQGP